MLGLIGRKIGMTQIFDDMGNLIPVTALKVGPNLVVQERTRERHGYNAIVLGAFPTKPKRLTKPVLGQFPKGAAACRTLAEIRNYEKECKAGDEIGLEIFEGINFVDIQGTSKGKGFQGVMKRHGFHGGRKSHGSKFHRAAGSTGMAASPSRVFKGTKMPGRLGGVKNLVQNLRLVGIDLEKGLLLVKGGVPGSRDSVVIVTKAKKK